MKISTEDELVGIDNMMPMILWNRYSMEAQGYHTTENIVNQYNQSTMLLASNRKASSGKRTNYINIRYLFVADRILNKENSVEYFLTDDMLSDFFTKPTQGSLFLKLLKLGINLCTYDIYRYDTKRSQEFVGSTYPMYEQHTYNSLTHT